ncbi:hypothetical protein AQF52_2781 [Streptomyces venezuelae]|nr:hypothetical protein AQF52_2781 [Streptomyces venezuelae]
MLEGDGRLRDGLLVAPLGEEQLGEVEAQGYVTGRGGNGGAQTADQRGLVGHAATL